MTAADVAAPAAAHNPLIAASDAGVSGPAVLAATAAGVKADDVLGKGENEGGEKRGRDDGEAERKWLAPIRPEFLIPKSVATPESLAETPEAACGDGSTDVSTSPPVPGSSSAVSGSPEGSKREGKGRGQNKKRGQNCAAAVQARREALCECLALYNHQLCKGTPNCDRKTCILSDEFISAFLLKAEPTSASTPTRSLTSTASTQGGASTAIEMVADLKCPFFAKYEICPYGLNCVFSQEHTRSASTTENSGPRLWNVYPSEWTEDEARTRVAEALSGKTTNRAPQIIQLVKARKLSRRYPAMKREQTNGPRKEARKGSDNFTTSTTTLSNPLVEPADKENKGCAVNSHKPTSSPTDAVTKSDIPPDGDAASSPASPPLSLLPSQGVRDARDVRDDESRFAYSLSPDRPSVAARRHQLSKMLKGKKILAPLTTVGNLPFRTLCVDYGADVTVSEMILASSISSLKASDLALLKRHESERIFGVQIAGGYGEQIGAAARILHETGVSMDFLELNLGCPIQGLESRGAGAAMMGREKHVEAAVKAALAQLNCPVALKMRMAGPQSSENHAHTLIDKAIVWGVSGVTVHGRTSRQRYLREADWDYIGQCAKVCASAPDGAPINFTGNGDLFDPSSVVKVMKKEDEGDENGGSGRTCNDVADVVDSVMIGRGALIKPWIFKEIRDNALYDISSSERFDMLKSFVKRGLEHWGSDRKGVETTRRFLLEQLSFSYRYIPVGLLEVLPQKLNQRPPLYRGRDELETLFASANANDWVEITRRLLGNPPDSFQFLPKHKSNAY